MRSRALVVGFSCARSCWIPKLLAGRCASVNAAIFASIVTASSGNLPTADSPESITQSVPSSIALATSVASARVGRRLETIDSSI